MTEPTAPLPPDTEPAAGPPGTAGKDYRTPAPHDADAGSTAAGASIVAGPVDVTSDATTASLDATSTDGTTVVTIEVRRS